MLLRQWFHQPRPRAVHQVCGLARRKEKLRRIDSAAMAAIRAEEAATSPGAKTARPRSQATSGPEARKPNPITLEDMSDQEGVGSASKAEATLTHPSNARQDRRVQPAQQETGFRRLECRQAQIIRRLRGP